MEILAQNKTIQARLQARLEQVPDGRAISFYSKDGRFTWQSYREFFGQAARYATTLAEKGVQPGDVCLLVWPSDEFAANVLLAIWQLGALPLLIAPPSLQGSGAFSSLAGIIEGIRQKSKPRVVILSETLAEVQANLEAGDGRTQFLVGEAALPPAPTAHLEMPIPPESSIAALQLTSGTTGFPRICVWRQDHVIATLDGMLAAMRLTKEDVCLNWTPLYHDMGLVNNFLLCMTSGVPVVMMQPHDFVKNPALWLRALNDTAATITWSPNFGYAITAQRVRPQALQGINLSHVRAFYNAAERIHHETIEAFHERFAGIGVSRDKLKTNFGCAENIGGATFTDVDGEVMVEALDRRRFQEDWVAEPIPADGDQSQAVKIVSAGRPYPGMTIHILSEEGERLPEGHIGLIALDSPSAMEGYLQDEEATRFALFDGLVRTGDLGYMRGGELFWTGRYRERINVRGVKLDPSDFEPVLLKVAGLRHGNFAAFGVDDPRQGTQRVVLVVEVRQTTDRSEEDMIGDIRAQVFQTLGVNVSEVMLVQEGTITKTSSGKRRHRHFRDLYTNGELAAFAWPPDTATPA
jgi:acyl-CoA synthetase (AMP-forming)/AMP-acid ligase II